VAGYLIKAIFVLNNADLLKARIFVIIQIENQSE